MWTRVFNIVEVVVAGALLAVVLAVIAWHLGVFDEDSLPTPVETGQVVPKVVPYRLK